MNTLTHVILSTNLCFRHLLDVVGEIDFETGEFSMELNTIVNTKAELCQLAVYLLTRLLSLMLIYPCPQNLLVTLI